MRMLLVVNLYDNKNIGVVGVGDCVMIDDVVWVVCKGYKVWSVMLGCERLWVLWGIVRGIEWRKRAFVELEMLDAGKLIEESEWDIDDVSVCFDYYVDWCDEVFGDKVYVEEDVKLFMDEFAGRLRREALGVIGLIMFWNYLLFMVMWKVVFVFVSGCVVVLKLSEFVSLMC